VVIENRIYETGISQHHISSVQFIIIYGIMFFIIAVLTFLFWLFYKLLYGFFLRKLKRNYDDLKKIEI